MDHFCSQQIPAQPQFGSSPSNKVWLLLEYDGVWREKATEDNDLPAAVQQWMQRQLAAIDGSRWIFIKRQQPQTTRRFYAAVLDPQRPRLYSHAFTAYEALTTLDVPALLSGRQSQERLALVCSNGRRDRCCALFGRAFFEQASAKLDNVWQSTHLGGHRFAPVVAVLPLGVVYGRLQPQQWPLLQQTLRDGEIALDFYRGRVGMEAIANAADYYLRNSLQLGAADGLALCATTLLAAADGWTRHTVTFIDRDCRRYAVTVGSRLVDDVLVSCSPHKRKPQPVYQLESIA